MGFLFGPSKPKGISPNEHRRMSRMLRSKGVKGKNLKTYNNLSSIAMNRDKRVDKNESAGIRGIMKKKLSKKQLDSYDKMRDRFLKN